MGNAGGPSEVGEDPTSVVVERLHYTYVVKDLTTFREEFRYVYSGSPNPRILPLIWRARGVEANMVITDYANNQLVYLPSARVQSIIRGILFNLWTRCLNRLPDGTERPPASAFDAIAKVCDFDATPAIAAEALKVLTDLTDVDRNSSDYIRLTGFISKLGRNYIPLVSVKDSSGGEYTFVSQGVDTLEIRDSDKRVKHPRDQPGRRVYGWIELLKFLVTGSIHFDVLVPWAAFENPPWERTGSLHFRVIMPPGLEVESVAEAGDAGVFSETPFIRNSKWDGGLFYAYLTPDFAAAALSKKRMIQSAFSDARRRFFSYGSADRRKAEGPPNPLRMIQDFIDLLKKAFLARDADAPSVRLSAVPVPGVRALLALFWIVTGLAYFYSLTSTLDEASYIGWFSALLIVVLSTVVYGLEKPFSRAPIIAQSIAATAALVELIPLHILFGR